MSQKYPLDETLSPINKEGRDRINENWTRIMAYFDYVQSQIKILSGGAEVGELVQRLNDAVNNANIAVQEAIDANNTATKEAIEANNTALQLALEEVSNAISQLESAITSANDAAKKAIEATNNADQAIMDAKSATQDALKAVTTMQNYVIQLVPKDEYNNEVQYFTNNIVTINGSSFIAKKDTKGNPPPTPPATSNVYWQVLASQGAQGKPGLQGIPGKDGKDGTGVNIIGELMSEDELPTTGSPGDAYMIHGDLYVWQENSGIWKNVGPIQGPEGKSAYDLAVKNGFEGTIEEWIESLKGPPGPPGPEGPPGPPADLTEINEKVDGVKKEVTEHLAQIASAEKPGHIKVGKNLTIDPDGTLNATASSSIETTTADINWYVSHNGNDETGDGTKTNPFKTINNTIRKLPKIINHSVTVRISSGIYPETINITGFVGGGSLEVRSDEGMKECTVNAVSITRCNVKTKVVNMTLVTTSSVAYRIEDSHQVIVSDISATTKSSGIGIYSSTSNAYISFVEISNKDTAIIAQGMSNLFVFRGTGTGNLVGLAAENGSTIVKDGVPTGTTAERTSSGGLIR